MSNDGMEALNSLTRQPPHFSLDLVPICVPICFRSLIWKGKKDEKEKRRHSVAKYFQLIKTYYSSLGRPPEMLLWTEWKLTLLIARYLTTGKFLVLLNVIVWVISTEHRNSLICKFSLHSVSLLLLFQSRAFRFARTLVDMYHAWQHSCFRPPHSALVSCS